MFFCVWTNLSAVNHLQTWDSSIGLMIKNIMSKQSCKVIFQYIIMINMPLQMAATVCLFLFINSGFWCGTWSFLTSEKLMIRGTTAAADIFTTFLMSVEFVVKRRMRGKHAAADFPHRHQEYFSPMSAHCAVTCMNICCTEDGELEGLSYLCDSPCPAQWLGVTESLLCHITPYLFLCPKGFGVSVKILLLEYKGVL